MRIHTLAAGLMCVMLGSGGLAVAAESSGDYGAALSEIYFAHQRLLADDFQAARPAGCRQTCY